MRAAEFIFSLVIGLFTSADSAPALTPGTWTDISPAGWFDCTSSECVIGGGDLALDPVDPAIFYWSKGGYGSTQGLYKTTDAGST